MRFSLPEFATPSWRRSRDFRRILAAILVFAALALTIHSFTDTHSLVLIATQDIAAGNRITQEDVSVASVPEHLQPEGAFRAPDELIGNIAVATIRKNEVITPSRVLGNELTIELVRSNTMNDQHDPPTMVPVVIADSSIIPLLQHGDTVNIVTQHQNEPNPTIIAAGGRVIATGLDTDDEAKRNDTTVLIALPQSAAHSVAGASLNSPLTVVITGPRANNNEIRMDQQHNIR